MAAWWLVQALVVDDVMYWLWNHSRYSGHGFELKNGVYRHPCIVKGCNACIYISNGVFRGKSDHNEWNNQKHSNQTHLDWGGAALIREEAIDSINLNIETGKTRTDAFYGYLLSHPHHTHALSINKMYHRLNKDVKQYPHSPSSLEDIPNDLQSKPQWMGNYYTHLSIEFNQKLKDETKEETIDLLTNSTTTELEQSLNEGRAEIATIQHKISLIELAITLRNSNQYRSDFFLAHNDSYTLFLFGEEGHFEILQYCELWLFDGTFDSTPSIAGYLLFVQEWLIHGCVPSGVAGVQSESFPTVKFLFAKGKGTMTSDSYKEAVNLLLKVAKSRGFDLNVIGHRALGDFEKAERNGITESQLSLLDGVVEGCGYHFTSRWKNALKDYNMWKPYLHDVAFKEYQHIFMCIRAVPKSRVNEGYGIMMKRARNDINRKYLPDLKRMAQNYLEPTWINIGARFDHEEWNEYRREIRANNHAETMNNEMQSNLGVHQEFYHWIWKSKEFSAKQLARWRRYKVNGFERKRKVKEHLKCLNLKDLWDKIGQRQISVYEYMKGVSYIYREKWSKLNEMFGSLNYENDKM